MFGHVWPDGHLNRKKEVTRLSTWILHFPTAKTFDISVSRHNSEPLIVTRVPLHSSSTACSASAPTPWWAGSPTVIRTPNLADLGSYSEELVDDCGRTDRLYHLDSRNWKVSKRPYLVKATVITNWYGATTQPNPESLSRAPRSQASSLGLLGWSTLSPVSVSVASLKDLFQANITQGVTDGSRWHGDESLSNSRDSSVLRGWCQNMKWIKAVLWFDELHTLCISSAWATGINNQRLSPQSSLFWIL